MATDVEHLGLRDVDAGPPLAAEAVAQVDILEVHEETLVEPPDSFEGRSVDHHEGSGQPADHTLAGLTSVVAIGGAPRIARPDPAQGGVADSASQ